MYEKDIMIIADDLDINRDILREMFRSEFDIIDAENGQMCIDLVEQYGARIKIILLDIMMPVMSGLEVLKYRKTNDLFQSIPVIVITANDEVKKQMTAFQLGATDYITKPFMREIVIYRINNVLSSKKRVDEIVKEKQNLQVKSELDLMTGLYNKTTVEGLIASKLAHNDKLNALLVIDIDNFKQVNDCQGHLVGDHTIRIIADLISGHFRKTDTIGRIGGDEFIVFMEDLPTGEIARRKANELAKLLRYKPNLTFPANVSVSIGITLTEKRPYVYEEIFVKADKALYTAKENGKGQYAEYNVTGKKEQENSKGQYAVLFSRNRDVCGIIHMANEGVSLIELLSPEEAKGIGERFVGEVCLLYMDISTEPDNGVHLLKQREEVDWLNKVPFFAVCQEGNMAQYKNALDSGAKDIIPSPIDITFLKRRSTLYFGLKRKA